MKILIVEDNENSRILLESALGASGYEVESAENGKIGLSLASLMPPDLIISDILMPEMDGYSLCRRVKKDKQLCNIPFIFYTATYTDSRDEKLAMDLGASRFIIKPMEMDAFLFEIKNVLENHRTKKLVLPEKTMKTDEELKKNHTGILTKKLDKKVRQLEESETKYQTMMDSMREPVFICSSDYNIEYMNKAMIKRTGRDATGENCFFALHNLKKKCPWCVHYKVLNNEYVESTIVSPKDNRSYHVSHSPLVHSDGSISKLTVYRDTTKMKKMEAQLRQAQKMEAIGVLAGGIAHDFNNILFPIVGYSEMLLMDMAEGSPSRKKLNEIYTSALRAKELVKQILTFARQDTTDLVLMKVQPILKEVLKLIRSTIPTTIEIKQDINPDCGGIKADPSKIHQIIMNLTTNAYHAMEKAGGKLKVSLAEVKLGVYDVIIPDMTPGNYICLTVADTGVGMEKDITEKIFDPFFTTKEQGKGTGLGLSVVHGIVKNMGGGIHVYSEPGKGSEFKVYFSIEKSSVIEKSFQTKRPIPVGTERILLVDDELEIVTMVRQMLERLGYQVSSRTSSIEALETFRANPDKFDMVITDMAMPNMAGDKLAAELKKICPDIPLLLCTGFSEAMSESKARSIGITGFLLKPVIMVDLAQKIREVLD